VVGDLRADSALMERLRAWPMSVDTPALAVLLVVAYCLLAVSMYCSLCAVVRRQRCSTS
jgi:hypothetical protein